MRIQAFLILVMLGFAMPGYAGKKLRVLFLGNSYTYYNNMPQMIADMATSTGDTLIWDMHAPGGYTLDDHDNDLTTYSKIMQGGWDYMVLQEQSQLPAIIGITSGLAPLTHSFKTGNPCGRVMLYMTWGRKNGDASNCVNFPWVCTYLGMDSAIRHTYITRATSSKTELSPVGAAWRLIRNTNPGINLYEPDDSHPTAAGSYLAASCFYVALFKKDPVAVTYNFSLSAIVANALKQAAKTVVYDSLSFWNHIDSAPIAGFVYNIGAGINQVQCINLSTNSDSYLWDFGDGNTSTLQHPLHNYAVNGTYTIKLTAYNCDIDTTYETTHQATVTFCPHTPVVTPQQTTICPGDTDTLWTQQYDAYQWYDENHDPVPGATGQSLVVSSHSRYYVEAALAGCTERSTEAHVAVAGIFSPWYITAGGNLVGQDTACTGDTVILSVLFNKPPVADDSLIDWSFNGQPLAGYHNDSLLITQPGSYEARVRHELCPLLYTTKQLSFTFVNCPTGISTIEQTPFVIAPNPVTDELTLSSPEFLPGNCTISIINTFGQVVYRQQAYATERQAIDMSAYHSGVYIISVSRQGRVLHRARVVKQ